MLPPAKHTANRFGTSLFRVNSIDDDFSFTDVPEFKRVCSLKVFHLTCFPLYGFLLAVGIDSNEGTAFRARATR